MGEIREWTCDHYNHCLNIAARAGRGNMPCLRCSGTPPDEIDQKKEDPQNLDKPVKLLRVPEVAEQLAISIRRVYYLLAVNELKSVKVGGCRRVPVNVLNEYVQELLNTE